MLYLLLGGCVVLFLLWRWFQNDPTEPPEIPGKLPFVGHGLQLLGNPVDMFNAIKHISDETYRLGGVIRLYLGPSKYYSVVDPDDINTVLNESITKHYMYGFGKPFVGQGLLTADVPIWRPNRKLLNPAFSQQVLDGFIDIFNERSESLVKDFAKEVGKPFDQEKYLRINNLKTICATSLGVDVKEYDDLQKNYLPPLDEVLAIINSRIQKFWYHSDFIFSLSPLKKLQDQGIKKLHNYSDRIIENKIAEMENPMFEGKTGKMKPFIYLIAELAKENPAFTPDHIRAETNTVIVGGHDTSASALTFALTLLGSHPEVQEKAYREIQEVMGDSKRPLTKEDLSKLVYIDAIVKESLRLFPSVPVVARMLENDIKLKNYTLKAGAGCIISIHGSGRHPVWGPDADQFRPDRWLDRDTLPPSKYYTPFGLGRRSCIGKTYAMMAMKVTVAHVVRSYILSGDYTKIVAKMETMIRPVDGFHISVAPRQ